MARSCHRLQWDTPEAREAYLKEYMPIKLGSPLFSKLNKKYWKPPHVVGKLLVFAVADFSAPMSMVHPQPALKRYLWGYEHTAALDANGELVISPVRIEQHQWGKKVIPSGFFRSPESKHVSAVISTNASTIAKFNRMGTLGKFGSKQVLLVREGRMVNHNPNAMLNKLFRVFVNSANYAEEWIEGLNVYHNPNAKIPLPMEMLPGTAHHFCDETGQVMSHTPHFHPTSSVTHHHCPVDVDAILAEEGDRTHTVWTLKPSETVPGDQHNSHSRRPAAQLVGVTEQGRMGAVWLFPTDDSHADQSGGMISTDEKSRLSLPASSTICACSKLPLCTC